MPSTPIIAMIPDSPDARLLVELSSYADDLSDAGNAMDLAIDAGSQSPLWSPLTSYAVVAYMRAFGPSNVRSGLLHHISIPEAIADTHRMIHVYRNTTVAHSQSQLSMSLPIALLSDDQRVEKVMPFAVRHDLPPSVATRIAQAIDVVSALVETLIKPLVDRLADEHAQTSPATIASWPIPDFNHGDAGQFTGDSRRRHSPRFTFYWDYEPEAID